MKHIFLKKMREGAAVKEAIDNLLDGICFFDKNGTLVLINRKMIDLGFFLLNRDIQNINDMTWLLDSKVVKDNNENIWQFHQQTEDSYTEVIATDVTELYNKKEKLEIANEMQKDIMRRLERITENVVSITRNEEILSMKMMIHNELGYALSSTRRFIMSEDFSDIQDYIGQQKKMAGMLMGEIGNSDEIDEFAELIKCAESLGMKIVINGELPDKKHIREIVTFSVRENLINTVKHAKGDEVYVDINTDGDWLDINISNNGNVPSNVREGGGLTSLRKKIEGAGGAMNIVLEGGFRLNIRLWLGKESI